ncbi:alkaline phosphatase, tissue-nonspecific isozyme-like [Pomacea canaliculata]|uniref:alkaline phosphatase, tissue-nonspecific isozyme-like n=1 Tax=Pomacea canaliculata TaxID=400727 RepID=UPI000D72D172|nr:alkaline phosphatase, tissue-nonspecific isozyme-like [Pomacea canaliculata]XP_025087401.1 alkaline phosphatase, tissue-nonspecific isozyme-like [Pomacea canaliculata]
MGFFTIFILLSLAPSLVHGQTAEEVHRDYWLEKGRMDLRESLLERKNTNRAKNVILFLGDGMGVSTVTAARIYKGQRNGKFGEETVLNFEKFPNVALSKVYNIDYQTPDSAGTATAYLCGVKTNSGTLGVDGRVVRGNCSMMGDETVKVKSVLKQFIEDGRAGGIVTTTRVTHATPGGAYAYSPDRDWESDTDLPPGDDDCKKYGVKDIAAQLVDDNIDITVVLGGGRRAFLNRTNPDPETGKIDTKTRLDGRDLTNVWMSKQARRGCKARYVWNKSQFDEVTADNTNCLLGLFNPSHMEFELKRNKDNEPSLAEMTRKAIEILKKNKNGFFLLVEGGRIDHGHHDNFAKLALSEAASFDDAVGVALQMTSTEDTLIVVTADHSHVFTIAGYAKRGNDILGLMDPLNDEVTDNMTYTALSYANGPGAGRRNLTGVDTTNEDFRMPALVPTTDGDETHGAEDVAVYATGPMAFLIQGVKEQNYIAHVMAYAACVGTDKSHCTEDHTLKCDISSAHSVSYLPTLTSVYLRLIVALIVLLL